MAGLVSDPLITRRVTDEALALMTEFGAGAALFANGQVMAAEREGRAAFADYRSAVLGAIGRAPTGDGLEIAVPAAPARLAHR